MRFAFTVTKDIDLKTASLLNIISTEIKEKGPMQFPTYWNRCLLHDKFGYYMKQDVFNKEGDFVTSVEISQMFNELLAVWMINTLQAMRVLDADLNQIQKVHIVEFGPGLGTLSCNVLRVFEQFKLLNNIQYSYIEFSDFMTKKQQQNVTKQLAKHDIYVKYEYEDIVQTFTSDGVTLRWFKNYEEFLSNTIKQSTDPVLVIAHEFFDALPVHIFEYQDTWKERLVDLDGKELKYTLSKTTAVDKILNPSKYFGNAQIQNGDTIEVCPQGQVLANQLAELISKVGGAALLVDYGERRAFSDSVRAIARHKLLDKGDILRKPGDCDLSAYVNFLALEQAALQAKDIIVPQLMTQGAWLEQMGIRTRLQMLCQNTNKSNEKRLQSEYERLVSQSQMGQNFKFMLMQHKSNGQVFPFIEESQVIYY